MFRRSDGANLFFPRLTITIESAQVIGQLGAGGGQRGSVGGGAAGEGAAVLAAWSIDLEGEQPGLFARARRQLARSAELPASTSAPRRPLSRASGMALFMPPPGVRTARSAGSGGSAEVRPKAEIGVPGGSPCEPCRSSVG
jgi:hypothetical protein